MKILKTFSICLLICFSVAKAQTLEGIISYSIQYEVVQDDRMDLEIYKSMIPQKMELSVKDHNSHLKFVGGMTQGLLGDILYHSKDKNLYSIFDHNKTAIQTSVESLKKDAEKGGFVAVKTSETSTILGYLCTRYIVKDEKEGTETSLWCTKSISNASASVMVYFLESMTHYGVTGIEGLPLKIQFKGKEFNLTLLGENKLEKKMSEKLFIVPEGYTLTKAN